MNHFLIFKILFLLQVLFTLSSIPFARRIQNFVENHLTHSPTLYLLSCIIGVSGIVFLSLRILSSLRNRYSLQMQVAYLSLLAGLTFIVLKAGLLPIEYVHIFNYALLVVLVKLSGMSSLAAIIIVSEVSLLDEGLQWLTPARFFDLRDLGINFIGCILGLILSLIFLKSPSFQAIKTNYGVFR